MDDKKELKSIEQILRDKFKTGYDPVTIEVRARAINSESLDVSIEGHRFTVRGNNMMFVGKGEGGIQIPQAKTEEAAAIDEGKMAVAAAKAVEASLPGVLPEEGNTVSPQSEPAAETSAVVADDAKASPGDEVSGTTPGADEGAGDAAPSEAETAA